MDLLIATTNRHKLVEIKATLAGLPLRVQSLHEVGDIAAPEENGATFAENARLKATYYARESGMLTAADDSGLEVHALGGAPGVHSARFNGTSYPEKFRALYDALADRDAGLSSARFVCAVALADMARVIYETIADVEGEVAEAPRGANGFGYDPIFFYPPFGRTFGEISPAEKLGVSHRGRAFRQLRAFLEHSMR